VGAFVQNGLNFSFPDEAIGSKWLQVFKYIGKKHNPFKMVKISNI